MNGATATSSALVGANPGTSWRVIGAGDFYGTLYSDILRQNLTGAVEIWEMNGREWQPRQPWAELARDRHRRFQRRHGYSDIVWQNTNGAVAIRLMNGIKAIASAVVGNPVTSWHVIGSADFNGDGYSDILWQNTNGAVTIPSGAAPCCALRC
jgi:FG-GAP repeat